ncbi:type VI secretion system baseplate subunit TssG [Paraburkholderia silviterrae]|uniref:Type VI secretion system baseplate subunit TssG n=1 Tax=Paraburkholderia silviterrae TaxID=2528715 RepID=A0A4R5M8G4_9BURK|nr:type VI secretion system baseplate subunit TssG [Paraburkholderia silviterrae]TDG21945.1 type VI secretion system baseplate subunit TssG [Paraburkholderia silviterrae]
MSEEISVPPDRARYQAFWRQLRAAPAEHDLFHLLRWIDALASAPQRLGAAPHPGGEPVRLGQIPSLAFAPSMVAGIADAHADHVPPRVLVHGFGLFGPNGPLPQHVTEYAYERAHSAGDASMSAFADVFHHPLLVLLYRAWADAQPVVGLDRPGVARFDTYVESLMGARAGASPLSAHEASGRHAKYFHAGHWVRQTRNPEGLAQMLRHDFGVPVRIVEHVVRWVALDARQRGAIGAIGAMGTERGGRRRRGMRAALGEGAVLGRAVRDAQGSFRIVLGPLPLARYQAFLPGGTDAARLVHWVREYVGAEFDWDLQLELAAPEVPCAAPGGAGRLGFSTWLGRRLSDEPARELVVDLVARAEDTARAGTHEAPAFARAQGG